MPERYHLPIIEAPKETAEEHVPETTVEREQGPELRLKIAKAFLANRYPLSEEGEKLREQIKKAIEQAKSGDPKPLEELGHELPTVEKPRLELFKNFELKKEDELTVFGPQLEVVQVTKGCRHQCAHCAADAGKNVEMMPFAAVMKIMQKIREVEVERANFFKDWHALVVEQMSNGPEKDAWETLKKDVEDFIPRSSSLKEMEVWLVNEARNALDEKDIYLGLAKLNDWRIEIFKDLEPIIREEMTILRKKAQDLYLRICERFPERTSFLEKIRVLEPYLGSPSRKIWEDFPEQYKPKQMEHYYDSDPFDYRDTTFLHDDGSPADYGDVFIASAPATLQSVHVTTAGWPKNDKVSQRAADKIVEFVRSQPDTRAQYREASSKDKKRIQKESRDDNIRVSVHPFEQGISQGDIKHYRQDIENTLLTLKGAYRQTLGRDTVEIIVIEADDDELQKKFRDEVITPLIASLKDCDGMSSVLSHPKAWWKVAHFSGRAKDETKNDPWDVMACMEGVHIWPNGQVAMQETCPTEIEIKGKKSMVPMSPGTRPKPIGIRLFEPIPKSRSGE